MYEEVICFLYSNEKLLLYQNTWEENNSSSRKIFFHVLGVINRGLRTVAGDDSMHADSQERSRLHCIQIHVLRHDIAKQFSLPSILIPPARFSAKPLTWPVINFKRLNGMKSNYTAHVSTVRQLVRLQFERWAPQWLQCIDLELCQL